jgi:hypothetical protein
MQSPNTSRAVVARAADDPSRRRFLAAGSAGAVFASLRSAIASEGHIDAELLRFGAQFDAAWRAESLAEEKAGDAEFQTACDVTSDVVDRILNIQARSIEGLCVKARALSWCHSGEFDGFLPEPGDMMMNDGTTDMRLADSICRDLVALAG